MRYNVAGAVLLLITTLVLGGCQSGAPTARLSELPAGQRLFLENNQLLGFPVTLDAYRLTLEDGEIVWHTREDGALLRLKEEPGTSFWQQIVGLAHLPHQAHAVGLGRIDPLRSGIAQIRPERGPGGDSPAHRGAGLDHHPGPVADRRHRLACLEERRGEDYSGR